MADQDIKTKIVTNINGIDKGRAKVFIVTHENGAIHLYRSGEERPEVAPDTLIMPYASKIFVKECLSLSSMRTRLYAIHDKGILKHPINVDRIDAGDFVFYKEAMYNALITDQKKISAV
jgi:hypothetical protein